jgi:hypothetical protein
MSAFYIRQESVSLQTPGIYSFICKSSIYVCTIYEYARLGIVDHTLTHVAFVTTAT